MRSTCATLLLLAGAVAAAKAENRTLKFRPAHVPKRGDGSASLYIVNGEVAEQGSLPWQVSVQEYAGGTIFRQFFRVICGGTIISSRTVLTAAHCVTANKSYRIVAGVLRLDEESSEWAQIRNVDRAIVHPKWNLYSLENDIAVMLLSDPFLTTSTVRPIPMAKLPADANIAGPCVASGWGRLSNEGPDSTELMKVMLNIVETSECRKTYSNVVNITIDKRRVCAGGHDGRAACNGDSGGPLVCRNASGVHVLTGVTSFGVICGDYHPTVFTSVAFYREWIAGAGVSVSSTAGASLTGVLTTLILSLIFCSYG